MGGEIFSEVLDHYIEDKDRKMQPSGNIAEDFTIHLACATASPHASVVALFELVKREDADVGPPPLSAGELQGMSASQLLTLRVCRHPGARAIQVAGEVPATLLALYPGLKGCDAILLLRRLGGDLVLPLALEELAMFRMLAHARNLFTLMEDADALGSSSGAFHRMVKLGAVIEAGSDTAAMGVR